MAKTFRVCLTGPESTGKTILAARLAAHFGTSWSPEFARQYATSKESSLTFDDVQAIVRGQMEWEDRAIAASSDRGLVIHDTDLLSTLVYSQFLYDGRVPPGLEDVARERRSDLYLLADADVPFVFDRVREGGDRQQLLAHFRATLERLDCRYEWLRGDWAERFSKAVAECAANVGNGNQD